MKELPVRLLLADDDKDDCYLFKEALDELEIEVALTLVHNGEQLMQWLNNPGNVLPQLLFLDLNMPKKNGFECLAEIRQDHRLKQLPVVVFSTSFNHDIVNLLYNIGAHFYITKPNEFNKLKDVIRNALFAIVRDKAPKPDIGHFVLQP